MFKSHIHVHVNNTDLYSMNYYWLFINIPTMYSPGLSIRGGFRAFNIFQVYQYFAIYRWYFLSKFEQFSWISHRTLFKIRRYQEFFIVKILLHRIRVCVNLGYCSPTHFQTRDPWVPKWVCLFMLISENIYSGQWKSLTQIYAPVSYDISGIKVSRGPVAQDC
jgi:hypothetical protein